MVGVAAGGILQVRLKDSERNELPPLIGLFMEITPAPVNAPGSLVQPPNALQPNFVGETKEKLELHVSSQQLTLSTLPLPTKVWRRS